MLTERDSSRLLQRELFFVVKVTKPASGSDFAPSSCVDPAQCLMKYMSQLAAMVAPTRQKKVKAPKRIIILG